MTADIAPLLKLSREERLEIIDLLWESMAEDDAPISEEKYQELCRRRAAHLADPETAIPADEVFERYLGKHV